MTNNLFNKIGALCYVIWGLLHLRASYGIYQLGLTVPAGLLQGRVWQGAWHLGLLAITSIGVALWLNWRGSQPGYWVNLVMVGATDLGFIFLLLLPGYVGLREGMIGPVFWLLGALFTTLGTHSTTAFAASAPNQAYH